MAGSTTRGAFPYPTGPDNWKLIRTAIQALADRIALMSALYFESTAGTRGAAGTAGKFHRATDTGAVSLDTGTAFVGIPTDAVGQAYDSARLGTVLASGYAQRSQGLTASRPTAGVAGRRYYDTQADKEYLDDGSAWHEILTSTSAIAAYVAKASTLELAEVTRNTLLALTAATDTAIPWVSATASAGFDTTVWSSGAATRLTIPAAQGGVYQVTAMLPFDVVGAAGQVRLTVKQNGGAIAADQRSVNANDVALATVTALPRRFAAGDYIEVFAYSSNARNVSSGFVMIPTLTVVRVGT